MSLSMTIPGASMDAEERNKRLEAAKAVTSAAPMVAPASTPAAAPAKAPKPTAAPKGLRPWEVAAVANKTVGAGEKQRVPLIMDNALRAKLDYLAINSDPKESMSDIACVGMAAECLRLEYESGLLVGEELTKAHASGRLERVLDNKPTALNGTSRMVVMVLPELASRMKMHKDMKLVKTVSELALAGIEDECNYRLKKLGML